MGNNGRPQHLARELLEVVVFLVGRVVGGENAGLAAQRFALLTFFGDGLERFRPGDRLEFALHAHERRLKAIWMIGEIETVAALHAEKLAVNAGAVAVIAADNLVIADAQRSLASVRAMRADRANVL